MKRIPAILSDQNGVLMRGKQLIFGSDTALQRIRQPLKHLNPKKYSNVEDRLPFVVVSNAGGKLEKDRTEEYNEILKLSGSHRLQEENLVLNYSPLRNVLPAFKDKTIIIGGVGEIETIAKSCGANKYVTFEEYCSVFPFLVPISRKRQPSRCDTTVEKLKQRLGLTEHDLKDEPFQVHGIFFLNTPRIWEEVVQVTLDLLSGEDGKIAEKLPLKPPSKHVPIYAVSDDFRYSAEFKLPRLALRSFNESLRRNYKLLYGVPLKMNIVGKPEKTAFEYAMQKARAQTSLEISNFYMIGDNPESDIYGANQMGIKTILVRTGIWNDGDNDKQNPATYVVENFAEAVDLILREEKII